MNLQGDTCKYKEGPTMQPAWFPSLCVPLTSAAYTDWLTTAIHSSPASSCEK